MRPIGNYFVRKISTTLAKDPPEVQSEDDGDEACKGKMATTANTATNNTTGGKVASSPLSLFSLDAAITEAKREATCGSSTTHHRRASVVVASDVPHAANSSSSVVATMIINDENAPPNEKRTIIDNRLHHDGGFLPLGKPRRSFVGTKTMRIPGAVAVVATASPAETTAAAATTTATTPVDSSDDEVEDLNGDGNSLESLSPYSLMSSSTPRPTSARGGIVGNERTTPPGPPPPPPSSVMNYSMIMTTTSLYNLMGGQSDVVCTPLTLELSRVLECPSFDNAPPSPAPAAKVIDEAVPGGDDDTPEDYSMPSAVNDDLPYPPPAEIVRIASPPPPSHPHRRRSRQRTSSRQSMEPSRTRGRPANTSPSFRTSSTPPRRRPRSSCIASSRRHPAAESKIAGKWCSSTSTNGS